METVGVEGMKMAMTLYDFGVIVSGLAWKQEANLRPKCAITHLAFMNESAYFIWQ